MNQTTAPAALDLAKLEALAIAYECENANTWYNAFEVADGITYEPSVDFIINVSPATILALVDLARRSSSAAGSEPDERALFEKALRRLTHAHDESFNRDEDRAEDYADYVMGTYWSIWQARAAIAQRAAPKAPSREVAPLDMKQRFEAWAREACNMPPGIPLNWDAVWTQAAWEAWQGFAAIAQRAASAPISGEQRALQISAVSGLTGASGYAAARHHVDRIDAMHKGVAGVFAAIKAEHAAPEAPAMSQPQAPMYQPSAQPVAAAPAESMFVGEISILGGSWVGGSLEGLSTVPDGIHKVYVKSTPAAPVAQATTASASTSGGQSNG